MALLNIFQHKNEQKEGEKMTNSALLQKKIKEKGVKLGFLVKKLNTSYHWLNKKINNEKN